MSARIVICFVGDETQKGGHEARPYEYKKTPISWVIKQKGAKL
jgi:hypothetical protein